MPRRPGITFQIETPSPPATLPRMDVAAFVGFATRGPIDVPVPVEDLARFRDVFGPPLTLVRDPETGQAKTAHLHRAVEAFFRNGGRRCWGVRVAQPATVGKASGPVERASFGVPGLVSARTGRFSTVRARCFGATFDELRVGTVLRRRLLPGPTTGARGMGTGASESLTLSWAMGRDTLLEDESIAVGDLLRVVVEGGDVVYAPVTGRTQPGTGTEGALEIRTAPTYVFAAAEDPLSREPPGTDAGVNLAAKSLDERFSNRPLPKVESVERLLFDLLVWEEQGLQTRLNRLGFTTTHPRAWTSLPVDADLFGVEGGEATAPDSGTLHADVFEPRFPLASPESPGKGPFLPFGMADRPDPTRTQGRSPEGPRHSRLERERLSSFSPDVFVDGTFGDGGTTEGLVNTSTATLGDKADDMIYVEQAPASGMHSLWAIREVTLLAVPDAVHRGWDEPQPITPDTVRTPSALNVTVDRQSEPPRIHLSWPDDRLNEDGVQVEVQEARGPTFEHAVVRYRGAESSVDRYVRRDDPVTLFFRYRVVAHGRPTSWSNTRSATLPAPDFDPCADRPGVPSVAQVANRWVTWELLPDSAERSLTYDLQVDRTPTFEAPSTVSSTVLPPEDIPPDVETIGWYRPPDLVPRAWYKMPRSPDTPAVRYVRLRARRTVGGRTMVGGWSNTVAVTQTLRERAPVVSGAEYDHPQPDTPGRGREGLLDVQRAMLRFSAARGDVLSILALPQHDQPTDARRHVARLQTPGAVLNYGEERTLSYGALYYPWLLGPVGSSARIAPTPPDGAACGMIADRTLRDGAWMAPANIPLADVPTVTPPLAADERARLETSPINAFAETPDGVLTLGTATLSRNSDLEPITTRRLLILVRRLVRREGPALVFENNTPLLRRRIAEQFDDVLRRLFDRGAFAGATPSEGYRIVADDRVNPPRQVERGRLVVELRIAPARPLKFLTMRLVQRSGQRPAVREPTAETVA